MPSYLTGDQVISYNSAVYSSNIGSTVMPEVLGLCDVCNKVDGEDLLSHLANHHPNLYTIILMTEKVIKAKQQIEDDNRKPETHANRLDSVED